MKTKTSKKAAKSRAKKAIKVKTPLTKLQTEAVSTTRGIAEAKKNAVPRLTTEALEKRQKAKGSVRKQGGPKIAALTTQKLKTLSRQIEIGPTKAE